MAIPNTPEFVEIISSLTRLNPNSFEFASIIISEEIIARTADGKAYKRSPVKLWYKRGSRIKIDSLIQKINSELKNINHITGNQIASAILLLNTYSNDESKLNALNNLISSHASSEVSQYYILQNAATDYFAPVSFGDFELSNLDAKRFAYKCQKTGSDYYELYGAELADKPCLARKRFSAIIINFHEVIQGISLNKQHDYIDKCLLYFESVSNSFFEKFWNDFSEQQDVQISAGLGVIHERYFKERAGSQTISIFLKIPVHGKNNGYVVPLQIGTFQLSMTKDFASNITKLRTSLKEEYFYDNNRDEEIIQTFKIFSKFVAKAYRYLDDKKADEGFLHFIIALDLVFGDKNESTQTVSKRTALLTYSDSKTDYFNHKKKINEMYDLRSKYVHQGISVANSIIDETKNICLVVFYSILRVNKYWVNKEESFTIDLWKKKIDLACSSLEAGVELQTSLKSEIGIADE